MRSFTTIIVFASLTFIGYSQNNKPYRVWVNQNIYNGILFGVSDSSMNILLSKRYSPNKGYPDNYFFDMPVSEIEDFSLRHSNKQSKGFAIGAGIGFLAGFIPAYANEDLPEGTIALGPTGPSRKDAFITGIFGGIIGGAIGSAVMSGKKTYWINKDYNNFRDIRPELDKYTIGHTWKGKKGN